MRKPLWHSVRTDKYQKIDLQVKVEGNFWSTEAPEVPILVYTPVWVPEECEGV